MKSFKNTRIENGILRIYPEISATGSGTALFAGKTYACAVGKAGICPAHLKREGDGKTPAGLYFPRQLFVRADRLEHPETTLPARKLSEKDGWCDDPNSADYNRLVRLPSKYDHEKLWREDLLYDLVLMISHNDDPVRRDKGSAVFFHIARPDFSPTRGCVAFQQDDFVEILKHLNPATLIRVYDRPLED